MYTAAALSYLNSKYEKPGRAQALNVTGKSITDANQPLSPVLYALDDRSAGVAVAATRLLSAPRS